MTPPLTHGTVVFGLCVCISSVSFAGLRSRKFDFDSRCLSDPLPLAVSQCAACPAGQFCGGVGLVLPTGPCAAGYYCLNGSATPAPHANATAPPAATRGDLCPAGAYCPPGSGGPLPCPIGTFSAAQGLPAAANCTPCTAGYYCPVTGLTAPYGLCQAGFYCPNGTAYRNTWDFRASPGWIRAVGLLSSSG